MGEAEVTPVEIARMAGVGRAAVSNWRRRYEDFPSPVDGSVTNPRFLLSEVAVWLRRQGKLAALPAEEAAWQQLRSGVPAPELPAAVVAAGEWLVGDEVARAGEALDPALRAALAVLAAEHGSAEALELLLRRLQESSRLPRVPREVADLMVALAGPEPAVIYTPACGTGELAVAAARARPHAQIRGDEADPSLRALAALRLAAQQASHVTLDDGSLRRPPAPELAADAVLCAPPAGDRDWDPTSDDLAYDPRWQYGVPPRAEPELAWVQHALANLRPQGWAVLLLPPAVAARPAGRRVRAELLRRGALRAVIGLPAGAAPPHNLGLHLWLLRRPAPDETAAELVIADFATGDAGSGVDWPRRCAALVDSLARVASGQALPEPVDLAIRAFRVMDLLDDAVDLAPSRRLHTAPVLVDPAEILRHRERLTDALGRLRTLLPAVTAVARPADRSTISIGDLARAGAVTIVARGVGREESEPATGTDSVPVWRVRDVLAGTGPTGRMPADQLSPELARAAAGDVLAPVIGHQLTVRVVGEAQAGTVLGPNLTLLRPDPQLLDSWFLAGFLGRDSNFHRAGSLGSVTRYDIRRAEVPRVPLAEQRGYGELFRQAAEYSDVLRAVVTGSGDLLSQIAEGLAAGALHPQ